MEDRIPRTRSSLSFATTTVSTEYLRLLAQGAEARGLPLPPLMSGAGIDPSVLDRRGARISCELVERLWGRIAARSGDPLFCLELVETTPFGAADLLDYVILSSATVGHALNALGRYTPLLCDAHRAKVVVSGDLASVRYGFGDELPYPRELALAVFAHRSREMFGPSWQLRQVSFTHAPLGSGARYDRIFQVPVYFGMPVDEVVFSRAVLAAPLEGSDARLHGILTAQADGLLAAIRPSASRGSFLDRVHQAVRHGLAEGDLRVARLAEQVGMSARTLQRRLQAEGLTHRELIRGLRHDLAARALDAPVSQGQIARALGYAGAGSFHRAFKIWAGMTPGQLRSSRPRARRLRPRSSAGGGSRAP